MESPFETIRIQTNSIDHRVTDLMLTSLDDENDRSLGPLN